MWKIKKRICVVKLSKGPYIGGGKKCYWKRFFVIDWYDNVYENLYSKVMLWRIYPNYTIWVRAYAWIKEEVQSNVQDLLPTVILESSRSYKQLYRSKGAVLQRLLEAVYDCAI